MGTPATDWQGRILGSAIADTTATIYPPKGMVIIAIHAFTATAFNATNGLKSEVENLTGNSNARYIDTELDAHGTGEIATQNGHNDNGGNDTGVITLASADSTIKQGMIVEEATMCPRSLTDPYIVKSISSTTLTVAKQSNRGVAAAVAANLASGSAAATLFFSEHGQGSGGLTVDANDVIPALQTIYGRWTSVIKNDTGRAIFYFGK
jgi:hypothetical protein